MIININGNKKIIKWHHDKEYSSITTGRSKKIISGKTTCYIKDINDKNISTGKAYCSELDNYNKKIGRKISLTRAIAHMPRAERSQIWCKYKEEVGI